MIKNLLEVKNVTKTFHGGYSKVGQVLAVDDISLTIPYDKPRIIAVVGESGSGKTTLGMMILGLIFPTSGKIIYKGTDIQTMSGQGIKGYRRQVQGVFQNPYEAFNPFYKVDHMLDVTIKNFRLGSSLEEKLKIKETALRAVRLEPGEILGRYPHQLSGGQLQRFTLARAFLLKPQIIVADEPVSMIDASLRAIVLDVMMNLKDQHGISQLYITHDLSTAFQISDEIYVTYKGRIVERGGAETIITNPKHPYTQLLISAIPVPDPQKTWEESLDDVLIRHENHSNDLSCKFVSQCKYSCELCSKQKPPDYQVGDNHWVTCFLYDQRS